MRYNKIGIILCLLMAVVLTGCKNYDDVQHYVNKVFISTNGSVNEVRIAEEDVDMYRNIAVGVAKPEERDIEVSFRVATELLDIYREAFYDPDVIILPEAHYDLSQAMVTIEAGKVKSNTLELDFVGLDRLDLEKRYVLPVTIASSSGMSVQQSAKTLYYVFMEASLVNVVMDMNENWAWPEWRDATPVTDMSTFTLESLVYGHSFKNEISTVMGIEDVFLVRIGDKSYPKDQLQIAYGFKPSEEADVERGNITNASMKIKTGRWYHIAVTFDNGEIKVYINGVEKATGNSGSTSVNFGTPHSDEADGKPRCFWIGYSYDDKRYLDGMVAETRIWSKALSAEEIAAENHFYKVEPDSEGLVAYWKFDEGEGETVKDYTAHGNHLTLKSKPKWIPVTLPENK